MEWGTTDVLEAEVQLDLAEVQARPSILPDLVILRHRLR